MRLETGFGAMICLPLKKMIFGIFRALIFIIVILVSSPSNADKYFAQVGVPISLSDSSVVLNVYSLSGGIYLSEQNSVFLRVEAEVFNNFLGVWSTYANFHSLLTKADDLQPYVLVGVGIDVISCQAFGGGEVG